MRGIDDARTSFRFKARTCSMPSHGDHSVLAVLAHIELNFEAQPEHQSLGTNTLTYQTSTSETSQHDESQPWYV
jgi:hypothetical protein